MRALSDGACAVEWQAPSIRSMVTDIDFLIESILIVIPNGFVQPSYSKKHLSGSVDFSPASEVQHVKHQLNGFDFVPPSSLELTTQKQCTKKVLLPKLH